MAGRRILYALALAGCLVFYAAYQKWFSWIVLLVMLLFPWLSLLLSLPDMLRLKLEAGAAQRIPMGAEERIRLDAHCPGIQLPVKGRIRITKPLTGERWLLKPGAFLPTQHCGGLIAEVYKARVYDYLGLFSMRIRHSATVTILVVPPLVKMDVPPDLTAFIARSWKPKFGGGYAENHEMRQYRPGDNLNQIHWKLSAKVGELMLREPMEPEQGLMLLTMDLCGTADALDRKLGHLLWLGGWLLDERLCFEVRALTANGIENFQIRDEWDLGKCVDGLLCTKAAPDGTIRDQEFSAAWQYHIGGDPGEA